MKLRGEIGAKVLKIVTIIMVIATFVIIIYGQKAFNEKIADQRQKGISEAESVWTKEVEIEAEAAIEEEKAEDAENDGQAGVTEESREDTSIESNDKKEVTKQSAHVSIVKNSGAPKKTAVIKIPKEEPKKIEPTENIEMITTNPTEDKSLESPQAVVEEKESMEPIVEIDAQVEVPVQELIDENSEEEQETIEPETEGLKDNEAIGL